MARTLADRLLHRRVLMRAPIPLFRHGLGWVFGGRLFLLEHTGRASGEPRYAVLEVAQRPAPDVIVAVSGLGRRSQWFRNVTAYPQVRVTLGRQPRPAVAREMSAAETRAVLLDYQRRNPRAAAALWPALRAATPDGQELWDACPAVELRLEPRTPTRRGLGLRAGWQALVGPLGPAATMAVLGAAGLGGLLVWRETRHLGLAPTVLTSAIAVDLVGGLVAFQLPTTRARYASTSGQDRLTFTAAHLQPFALPLTGQGSWGLAAARYAVALAATASLARVSRSSDHRRLVAAAAGTALSVVDWTITSTARAARGSGSAQVPDQRWFGPVFLMKLVAGHASIPRVR